LKNCFAECFTLALGKEAFAECFFLALGKEVSLPSVFFGSRQRNFFAESRLSDARQRLLCRVQRLCRVFFIWLSAKPSLPSARKKTLGKASGARQRSGFR
jgi:hypothetical protein